MGLTVGKWWSYKSGCTSEVADEKTGGNTFRQFIAGLLGGHADRSSYHFLDTYLRDFSYIHSIQLRYIGEGGDRYTRGRQTDGEIERKRERG